MEPQLIIDDVPKDAVAATKEHLESIKAWPTTVEFMEESTQAEAVAFAAYEILSVQEGLIKSLLRLQQGSMPTPVKVFFEKKIRSAVSQLYSAIPNQVVPMVEWMVMEEQLGGPEAVAKMQAELEAAQSGAVVAPADGVVDGTAPTETVNLAPQGQDGSSPSDATISLPEAL